MAPYDFNAPDTDAILRSSDGKELRVHQLILSLSSPVFQGMFGLPQPTGASPEIPRVDVPEPSDTLQPFSVSLPSIPSQDLRHIDVGGPLCHR